MIGTHGIFCSWEIVFQRFHYQGIMIGSQAIGELL